MARAPEQRPASPGPQPDRAPAHEAFGVGERAFALSERIGFLNGNNKLWTTRLRVGAAAILAIFGDAHTRRDVWPEQNRPPQSTTIFTQRRATQPARQGPG